MKIEVSTIKKIKIFEVDGLDPINVYLEDIAPRVGRIVIECYGKSWSAYWGGMGDRTIGQFFCSCDNGYLAKNLSSIDYKIIDYDNLDEWLYSEVIRKRRNNEITSKEARHIWTDISIYADNCEHWLNSSDGHSLCSKVFGEEYWYSYPRIENPEYTYLCRIIEAVKSALKIATPPQEKEER